MIYHRNRKL